MEGWNANETFSLLTEENNGLSFLENNSFGDLMQDISQDKHKSGNNTILTNIYDEECAFKEHPRNSSNEELDFQNCNESYPNECKERRDLDPYNKRVSPIQPVPYRKSLESGFNNVNKSTGLFRKCCTPSPYMLNSKNVFSPKLVRKSSNYTGDSFEKEKLFRPIQCTSSGNSPIELHVTNLDQSIDPIDMKKIVLTIFGEHVMVLHVAVFVQSDGIFAASVKVPSIQDAQLAISQLHRRKIGHKKIIISYGQLRPTHSPQFIRWQVVNLLKEVPALKLPLFKFIEMFESRYVTKISVSDLFRLKDCCIITNESIGRMVSLHPNHRVSPTRSITPTQDVEPYCVRHYKVILCPFKGWAEQEVPPLPNVMISLPEFSNNILNLLKSHNNVLPLASLCECYNSECGTLELHESGVPLEHLVTCISNVELSIANGVKFLKTKTLSYSPSEKFEDKIVPVNPSLANVVNLFGRELVELLKTQPHCLLLFNKFVPTYHHRFGRQCRVADYGFTKLIDLLEALPNIIQVLGEGKKRMVTLSHRAQIRRFTSDLLRVLKTQPCKRLVLSELSTVFEKVLEKPFDPVDYGLCYLTDLVDEVSKNAVQVFPSKAVEENVLAIPKREQTPCEIKRTKLFSQEVIELLGLAPQCSILFDKFIPAYHHHYGHQCRVADFGFTKLIELFEAIPEIVELDEDMNGERRVTLTKEEKLKVIGEQICELVTPCYPPGLPLSSLETTYLRRCGYALKPNAYYASDVNELVDNIPTVQLVDSVVGKMIVPVEEALIKHLTCRVKKILITSEDGKMYFSKMKSLFNVMLEKYITPINLSKLIPEAVQVYDGENETVLSLTPLYQLARQIALVLAKHEGRLMLRSLQNAYSREYQNTIPFSKLGFPDLETLLAVLPEIVVLRGRGFRRVVLLNKDIFQICKQKKLRYIISEKDKTLQESSNQILSRQYPDEKLTLNENNNIPIIKLPEFCFPPTELTFSSLISPCKGLLPPSARPIRAPHPSQLPSPNKDSKVSNENGTTCKISLKRSGYEIDETVMTNHFPCDEPNKFEEKYPLPKKRRIRLAAQFEAPFDF